MLISISTWISKIILEILFYPYIKNTKYYFKMVLSLQLKKYQNKICLLTGFRFVYSISAA